jgi:glycosyltransferase involved in cell wall biosynthesis
VKQRAAVEAPISSPDTLELLGLFPAFQVDNAGGIQVSGQLAWEAVMRDCEARGRRAHALQVDLSQSAPEDSDPNSTITRTRVNAAMQVLRANWSPHSILCWHADLLPLIPLIRGVERRVLFLHGIEAWQQPGWVKQRLLAGVDLLLANSEFTLKRAREAAPVLNRIRSEVVPLGIGHGLPVPTSEPQSPPAAIMIGRLDHGERYKGHDTVIEAWPAVRERLPDARLWIVGEGSLRAELQLRVNTLGLNQHVLLYGRVDEEKKVELLRRARALLLPSRAEGFGLVYAEAMRLGRPSLVGSYDAGREVVNPPECGLAADPDQPSGLADAIVRLLTAGPEWDTWNANALQRYGERYTAAAFQKRLVRALWHP